MESLPVGFPYFKYHPDPLKTGAIEVSDRKCLCCERARGYVYARSPYSGCGRELDRAICPWCIADGSAAKVFQAQFYQDYEGENDGGDSLSDSIVDELSYKTPGYDSWQGELWLVHCDDAMVFHGDASTDTLIGFDGPARDRAQAELPWLFRTPDRIGGVFGDWSQLIQGYEPGGDTALYHFRCLHCGIERLGSDSC